MVKINKINMEFSSIHALLNMNKDTLSKNLTRLNEKGISTDTDMESAGIQEILLGEKLVFLPTSGVVVSSSLQGR